jgi:hypothetical protein
VIVIILSSSDSAPLSSVMMCWNIVATTVNMSFTDELFLLGVWTGWLGSHCWLCLMGGGALISPTVVGRRASEAATVAVCCCIALPLRIVLGWRSWRRTPHCSLGGSLWVSLAHRFLGMSAASIVGDGWGSSPSTNLQLQHVGANAVSLFSRHSLCRWPPPHHIQWVDCLQLAQTWPNYWKL